MARTKDSCGNEVYVKAESTFFCFTTSVSYLYIQYYVSLSAAVVFATYAEIGYGNSTWFYQATVLWMNCVVFLTWCGESPRCSLSTLARCWAPLVVTMVLNMYILCEFSGARTDRRLEPCGSSYLTTYSGSDTFLSRRLFVRSANSEQSLGNLL
jgi:hypothetical protein